MADQGVKLIRQGNTIRATAGGRDVLTYQGETTTPPADLPQELRRGGYIHPLCTPSGLHVTDDYEPTQPHHHGVWSAWTKTEFDGRHPDFWNVMEHNADVLFVSLEDPWHAGERAGFRARHRFVELRAGGTQPVLDETWDIVVHAPMERGDRPYNVFDLTITQTCATARPLTLIRHHYGGLGVRGPRQWKPEPDMRCLTSEGKDRVTGNESRGRWCHIGGDVNGKPAGIAVFCHPTNFRHPQPMRIHPSQPFFCYAPPQLGEFRIEPGRPYIARYRFAAVDGPPDGRALDAMWDEYAAI